MILPKKILIASHNKGKISEISALLKSINIESIAPPSNLKEPEETGLSFLENSLLKAKYYANHTKMISLADDSGLCVVDLNNQPGIHSARFAFDETTSSNNFNFAFEKIFSALKQKGIDIPKDQPKAYFICNLSLFDPQDNSSISFEGRVDGTLSLARGHKGFGYDPIFIKNGLNQTFGEIEPELKDKISHRALAFEKLINYFHEKRN